MISLLSITNNTSIIQDFNTFLNYCEKEKPKLTPSHQQINRKSLHELNQQLETPVEKVTAKNDQHHYLPIHFFYHLALEADLLEINRAKKTVTRLVALEDNINSFRGLAPLVQYLFLLKTYWVHCDWQFIVSPLTRHVEVGIVDSLLQEVAKSEVGKEYKRLDKEQMMEYIHWLAGEHIVYWGLLGWINTVTDDRYGSKSRQVFKSASVTSFGKSMAQLLLAKRPFSKWNETYLEFGDNGFGPMFGMEDTPEGRTEEKMPFELPPLSENPGTEEIKQHFTLLEEQARKDLGLDLNLADLFEDLAQKGYEPSLEEITDHIAKQIADGQKEDLKEESFEAAFYHLFDNQDTPVLDIKPPVEFVEGLYLFRISLAYDKEIWRTVLLNADHTLTHLHLTIQTAFEFDNDHLYSFYMDNKVRGSRKVINDPRGGQPPFSSDYKLGELGLSPNQRFLYLFDYGDSWEFYIDLLEISTKEMVLPFPEILDINGDAPEQYGYDEDFDFEEEDL